MTKTIIILISVFLIVTSIKAQVNSSKQDRVKQHIIALEKSGWQAWKNKDVEWFKTNTTSEFLSISSSGISDKSQVIESTLTDCDVKSVALTNFKFVMLEDNVILLTYTATQDGICNSNKLAEKLRASVNYVKRDDKWLEAFYMETPITE